MVDGFARFGSCTCLRRGSTRWRLSIVILQAEFAIQVNRIRSYNTHTVVGQKTCRHYSNPPVAFNPPCSTPWAAYFLAALCPKLYRHKASLNEDACSAPSKQKKNRAHAHATPLTGGWPCNVRGMQMPARHVIYSFIYPVSSRAHVPR
jgi:hypothetical protein